MPNTSKRARKLHHQDSGSLRLAGRVENLRASYGFVLGDDGVPRLFLPSYVGSREQFEDLQIGQRIEFTSAPGKPGKGPRAVDIVALTGPGTGSSLSGESTWTASHSR